MNAKTLLGLLIAAIVAIVAAVFLNHGEQPRRDVAASDRYLAPELRGHVNDVAKVVVTAAGGKTIATLVRGAKGWSVTERHGFPADTGKLRGFLLKLADAKLVEPKTSDKDRYSALGVGDVAGKDAKGTEVELDGLAKPLKIIIGNPETRSQGTFVRIPGEAQSWLASGDLAVPRTTADWLARDLVDIAGKRITDVTITHPKGGNVHTHKAAPGDPNFTLLDIPKGREATSAFAPNGPSSALANLRLEDVQPATGAPPPADAIKARYLTFDGVVVDATAWSGSDKKDYVTLAASLDAQQADQHIAGEQASAKSNYEQQLAAATTAESQKAAGGDSKIPAPAAKPVEPLAVSDPGKDRTDKLAAINKEIASMNATFSGWTFEIAPYAFANMSKSLDDLTKPIEKKKPEKAKKR